MISFKQILQDGGEDFSKLVTMELTSDTEDPAFFVVQKSSTAARTTTFDNAELYSIASPEDMRILSTVETYPGKYRCSSAIFCFSTVAKQNAATAAIYADLLRAVPANRLSFVTAATYPYTSTAATLPLFGD